MPDALYTADGDRFVPGPLTTGPWDRAAQHGGPPAALLVRAVEAVPADVPVQIARVTYELLRPVPLVPLEVRTRVLRPGRKVQLVQASLHIRGDGGDDVEVMRATALRIRTTSFELPPSAAPPVEALAGPEAGTRSTIAGLAGGDDGPAFHRDATDIRFVEGSFAELGPATAWVRLTVPVVAGEEPSPTMRAVAAADFGNGFSRVLPPGWLFINPDLTVHLARPPEGEWVRLRATSWPTGQGAGFAEGALADRAGRFGRSVQSLLLDRLP